MNLSTLLFVMSVTITTTIGLTLIVVTWIQSQIGVCELCNNGMYVMGSPP